MLSQNYALDLSGLQQLGMLFTALFQAFWPIFVILFVASILLALLGIGAKFGIGGIFKSVNPSNKLMKRKKKASFAVSMAFMLFILLFSSSTSVRGGGGTSGTLEIGVTNILGSTPITIRMFGLDTGEEHKVNWTGDNTGHNFTTGSVQTQHFITVNIDKPSGSNDVTVFLWGDGTTALDSLSLFVSDSSIFPDDIIIDIGITLAIVFIIVAVVASIKGKRG